MMPRQPEPRTGIWPYQRKSHVEDIHRLDRSTCRRCRQRMGTGRRDANKNSGITWNEASFKEYIKDPSAKVPGTTMIFAGIKNDKEIDDLWAYLKQFDAQGHVKK